LLIPIPSYVFVSVGVGVKQAQPKTGLRATLADARFVLKPDIDLLDVDIRRQGGLSLLGEVFF
jgi:hypothetical protein